MPRALSMTPSAIRARERRAAVNAMVASGLMSAPPRRRKAAAFPGAPKALHRKELAGMSEQQLKCAAIVEAGGQFKVHRKKKVGPRSEAQILNTYKMLLRNNPAGAEKYALKHNIANAGPMVEGAPLMSGPYIPVPFPS